MSRINEHHRTSEAPTSDSPTSDSPGNDRSPSRLRRVLVTAAAALAITGVAVTSAVLPGGEETVAADPASNSRSNAESSTESNTDIVEERERKGVVSRSESRQQKAAASRSESQKKAHKAAKRHASATKAHKAAKAQKARKATQARKARQSRRAHRQASSNPRDIARAMLPEFGFSISQFSCLDMLYVSESNWRVHADNPSSSAYGIPQALTQTHDLPGGYMTSAKVQIRWGLNYIKARYGTPCAAWSFKSANNWY